MELNDLINKIHKTIEAKEIAIDFSTKHKHMIKNYKNELAQAVLNILRNSQEAIVGRNIENGLITIGVSQTQDSIEINILDNGGGVEDGQMEKIFDPYYTTKYKANDVGLGLYLSKMMVEKNMGGTLAAQNYQDGLKMQIRLPQDTQS